MEDGERKLRQMGKVCARLQHGPYQLTIRAVLCGYADAAKELCAKPRPLAMA